jgi:serine protease SohB
VTAVDKVAEQWLPDGFSADRIIAAPFALVGSIGVVANSNVHRLLKHDVDVGVLTAGKYKRTLYSARTRAGRAKFVEELEDVHAVPGVH